MNKPIFILKLNVLHLGFNLILFILPVVIKLNVMERLFDLCHKIIKDFR